MILLSTGSPRVPGDEEEEDTDDLENEFNFELSNQEKEHVDAMLHGHMSYGGTYDHDLPHHMMHQQPRFPLLTNGQMVSQWPTQFLTKCSVLSLFETEWNEPCVSCICTQGPEPQVLILGGSVHSCVC